MDTRRPQGRGTPGQCVYTTIQRLHFEICNYSTSLPGVDLIVQLGVGRVWTPRRYIDAETGDMHQKIWKMYS